MPTVPTTQGWTPALDLTETGMSQFDPARIEQAIADGYVAGEQAGRAAAAEAIEQERSRLRHEAHAVLLVLDRRAADLEQAEAVTAEAFADRVATTAVALARRILDRELSDETRVATDAVRRVLARLDRRSEVQIRLNPMDAEFIDRTTLPERVVVETDPALARGDAVAVTDDRTVDARIEAALTRAMAALEGNS